MYVSLFVTLLNLLDKKPYYCPLVQERLFSLACQVTVLFYLNSYPHQINTKEEEHDDFDQSE